jgi:hypothetical protein
MIDGLHIILVMVVVGLIGNYIGTQTTLAKEKTRQQAPIMDHLIQEMPTPNTPLNNDKSANWLFFFAMIIVVMTYLLYRLGIQ